MNDDNVHEFVDTIIDSLRTSKTVKHGVNAELLYNARKKKRHGYDSLKIFHKNL